jgi:hypothetical protein
MPGTLEIRGVERGDPREHGRVGVLEKRGEERVVESLPEFELRTALARVQQVGHHEIPSSCSAIPLERIDEPHGDRHAKSLENLTGFGGRYVAPVGVHEIGVQQIIVVADDEKRVLQRAIPSGGDLEVASEGVIHGVAALTHGAPSFRILPRLESCAVHRPSVHGIAQNNTHANPAPSTCCHAGNSPLELVLLVVAQITSATNTMAYTATTTSFQGKTRGELKAPG